LAAAASAAEATVEVGVVKHRTAEHAYDMPRDWGTDRER
jgi:hypothetical protein